jgi:hypothetical protein
VLKMVSLSKLFGRAPPKKPELKWEMSSAKQAQSRGHTAFMHW